MEDTSTIDIKTINEKIEKESAFVDLLMLEMNKVIVGQKHMVERLLIGLLRSRTYFVRRCSWISKNISY